MLHNTRGTREATDTRQVSVIVSELGADGQTVLIPTIVARIRERAGCSRAIAYRGVADAFAAGAVPRVRRETDL
jgi:hypothetical protein